MREVSELRKREVETYFEVVTTRGTGGAIDALAFHNLGVYDDSDFAGLVDVLASAGATASFAFLGRDVDEQAEILDHLDSAGHEIVLHGQRHVACADLPEALARENVETGLAAIEDASGVGPAGFFAPLQRMNEATLDVLADAGLNWAVGRTEAAVPAGLRIVEPEPLVDLELLMAGHPPEDTFERLSERAEQGGVFLMHPNLIEYYKGTDAFERWIQEFRPSSVGEWLESDGVGLLLDAVRPLKIE